MSAPSTATWRRRQYLLLWIATALLAMNQFRALQLTGTSMGALGEIFDEQGVAGLPSNRNSNPNPHNLSSFSLQTSSAKELERRKLPSSNWRLPGVKNITGRIEAGDKSAGNFMLDFAIVGFPKTGSSTMMLWLGQHAEEIAAFKYEVKTLQVSTPINFIRQIYTQLPNGPILRGYKSPTDLENRRALNKLSTFFPTARLIIGIRHPIRWFESFYNFRVQNSEKKKMPPATEIGMECWKNTNGVCGGRAMFHNALAGLGKTPMSDDSAEMSLFDIRGKLYGPAGSSKSRNQTLARDSRIRNQVFIYDLE